MKKLFLIPLMALLCTAMAWGTEVVVYNFNDLKTALSSSGTADVIKLGRDIAYPTNGSDLLNITRSLTLDGQGYKIVGWGKCNVNVSGTNNQNTTLAINAGVVGSALDVTVKNISIKNTTNARYYGLIAFDEVSALSLKNVSIETAGNYGAQQSLCFAGADATPIDLTIEDSYIDANTSGYPAYILKPLNATIKNTIIKGYCGLYFKYRQGNYGNTVGCRGSELLLDACAFVCPNVHNGASNDFALLPFEEDGITLTLKNCSMNAEQIGDQSQSIISLQWIYRTEGFQPVVVNFEGDNTHIYNVKKSEFIKNFWAYGDDGSGANRHEDIPFTVNVTGGTFAFNLDEVSFDEYESPGTGRVTIPSTHEVQEVKQGDATLWRVVKKAEEKAPGVKYDLNDDVPTDVDGEGNNPNSSFELSSGSEMELNQTTTNAGYVQVKDNGSSQGTTVKVGKVVSETPVDQTLVINNGLDVQGKSKVEVQAGSAIVIGEGGITTEKPENIVIESTEEAQGALLLDPTITVNQNPKLTVKLKTHSKLNEKKSPTKWEYTYQRFAIPVMLATAGYVTNDFNPATNEYYDDEEAAVGFESYVWQWTGMQWETTTWNALERSIGYQLSNNSKNGDVTYTFTGNLIGNTNTLYEFDVKGFKFFGNSYTAPIMIEELLKGFKEIYPDVEASVWVYNYANKGWKSVNLDDIAEDLAYATTIKSMDGFILNLRSANSGVAGVDYTSAIWNNPDINPKATPAPARRSNASTVTNGVIINVVASEVGDDLTLVEREDRNSSFENGADASKVMNESGLNIYAETPAGTLSRVATDNLLGTQITFDAIDEEQYTLSFSNVRGSSYALRDNVTEKVIELVEGGTYEFTQAANSSITNRFEIVAVENAPTAIDNVENNVKARGIYTVLGQYVGEASQWSTLPAGVYVVDGVKVVK